MAEKIEHSGVVQSVSDSSVRVLIVQNAACSACAASSTCMASERKEKIIDALPLNDMSVGDEVKVVIERRLGFKAVLLAFVLPFLVVIALVSILTNTTDLGDGWIGTIALFALVPYYFIVALFKDRLKQQFTFFAEKI